jgi:hypothetical protein
MYANIKYIFHCTFSSERKSLRGGSLERENIVQGIVRLPNSDQNPRRMQKKKTKATPGYPLAASPDALLPRKSGGESIAQQKPADKSAPTKKSK